MVTEGGRWCFPREATRGRCRQPQEEYENEEEANEEEEEGKPAC
jgi:hypothetical protein